jgi:subtilase family serine protease
VKRLLALVSLFALAACSGAGTGALPGGLDRAGAGHERTAADSAQAQAADSPQALPGDSPQALPGDSPQALPGASYTCWQAQTAGSANCTLTVNVTIPPLKDPQTPALGIPGYHPADLQSAYGLPAGNPGGTVAVVDAFDDPTAELDLAVYRAAFGLPPCTSANGCFRKLNGRGQPAPLPAPSLNWSQETALDLAMVSAGCPRCAIVLVEADSSSLDDLGGGVDAAAALGPLAISNSYYAAEWAGEQAEDAHYRHPGIAITASSGDHGRASYPAASPYVTAVGGTTLSRGWSETPWAYAGRGCSAYVSAPAWQTGDPCATRSAVDVAAVADPATGVAFFSTAGGGWLVAGGTSVGAPLVAAAYALSGNPAGPGFSYAHASAFRPAGSTLQSGLGSPLGVAGL